MAPEDQKLWEELMKGVDTSNCTSPHDHALLFVEKLVAEVHYLRATLQHR
jgi:hypothetical protein